MNKPPPTQPTTTMTQTQFFTQTACSRCGDELHARILSKFNSNDVLCMACKAQADKAECDAVRAGIRDFAGVGLSEADSDFLASRRALRGKPAPATGEDTESPFGPVIYAYTRAQALADGFQVDVTETAKEAGIRWPTFLTRAVWDKYVKVPDGVQCQDERGRLWDIVWMTRFAIRKSKEGQIAAQIEVKLNVRNDNRAAKLVRLKAVCGPLDMDKPEPAITIMLTDED